MASALLVLALCAQVTAQDALPLSRGTLLAPKAFRAAADKVAPLLVRIEGFGGVAPGSGGGYPAAGEGPTTGLVVSSEGHVLTSTFNFLRKPPIITVVDADGRRHVAELLGRDETRKLCLLKCAGVAGLSPLEIAPRGELRVGQWAVAVGVGFGGAAPSLSVGIVSALSRHSGKAVQTDANTSPANYGGPLLDVAGRVIGICVPVSPGNTKEEAAGAEWYDSGIGFAIPLDGLAPVLERLQAGETLRHPHLGVQVQPFGNPPSGAEIKEVVADSPAAKAGLEKGDKLQSLAGEDVIDAAQLGMLVGRHLAGDTVEVVVLRGEVRKTLSVVLAAPPAEKTAREGTPEKQD